MLTLFTFSGTLAMHIFVPALPHAAEELGASISTMQMTVSLYILGLAVGQLIYGPVSDRFGRRPVLMVGLVVYVVAGLAAAMAPGAQALIAARLFQALGGCAGLVLGRTIVRDITDGNDAARNLALMNLMVTVGPGVAPILGALLADTLGWRSIFWMLAAFGTANLVMAWRLLPETAPPARNSGGAAFLRHGFSLLKSPAFLGYAIGGGCATTAMFAFVASAPFIFMHQLGRPPHEVGFYLAFMIFGIWLGSALVSRLIGRVRMEVLLVRGNLVSALAAWAFLILVLSGHLSVIGVMSCMFVFTLGLGVASPMALTQAMSVNPRVIGSASGLYGCLQMGVGALCTALVGLGSNPALAAATVLAVAGVIAQLCFAMALRRGRAT